MKKKRNLIALQWKFDDNSCGEYVTGDWEDDNKELAQEINKEKGLVSQCNRCS